MKIHSVSGRVALALFSLIVALGRLGLYQFRSNTRLPEALYGVVLLIAGVALLRMRGCKAYTKPGRLSAVLCMAGMAGLATDVAITTGTLLNTSVLNLILFTLIALAEVIAHYDCKQ